MKIINFKTQIFLVILICLSSNGFSQNYYPATGPVAFGTPTAPISGKFSLQLHGVNDYIQVLRGGLTVNHGKTAGFHLTNTTTGSLISDGLLMRMSGTKFTMENLEVGRLNFKQNTVNFMLEGVTNRIYAGISTPSAMSDMGFFNLQSTSDNGLYIRTLSSEKYGLSIRCNLATDNAIQVMGTSGVDRNFAVKANGEVFARKYTTTLSAIPDYVFSPTYKLMPLSELRTYLKVNTHLPNIPSAEEYAETGVDLGELNRLLLEKVEELTLYVLELEERISTIETIEE